MEHEQEEIPRAKGDFLVQLAFCLIPAAGVLLAAIGVVGHYNKKPEPPSKPKVVQVEQQPDLIPKEVVETAFKAGANIAAAIVFEDPGRYKTSHEVVTQALIRLRAFQSPPQSTESVGK